ncbi:MAG: AsmA family protein [Gammaproteobacteria bacterium]
MKWIKRLSALLAGLLLVGALIVAAVVVYFDESDHKRLLVWAAGQFLDSELVIEGPLELDIARNLSLATGDIQLDANDGSYRLSVGNLKTNFRLGSYLQTGTFWFNSLELTDVNIDVTETADSDTRLEDFQLPPVVIAQAKFNNLALTYREQPPGTLHRFSLDELIVEESGRAQPVSLRATGLFEDQPFVLEGTSDSIAQLLEDREPSHVQLSLRGAKGHLRVEGTIADPIRGRGLDLQVQADIEQLKELVEIFWDEIPVLGSLQGSMTVRGDYTAPRLQAIDLRLAREPEARLTVTGSVADVFNGKGLDLQIDGMSSKTDVLSWLLFKQQDRMQSVDFSGRLQGDLNQLTLQDVAAKATGAAGMQLDVKGNADIHPAGHQLRSTDAGLQLQFSAPSQAVANLPGLRELPLTGPLSGTLALALAQDAVGIYQADVTIGSLADSRVQLSGDLGHVQLKKDPELAGLRLATDIRTSDLTRLGKQLGYDLPALGPARLRGTLVSRDTELILQGARINIGGQGKPTLKATGMLARHRHDPTRFRVVMDVNIEAGEFAELGEPFGHTLPELGPTRITGQLVSAKTELQFRDVKLEVGAVDQPMIRANGRMTTQMQKGSTIHATIDVDVRDLIRAFTDQSPGYLGRLNSEAEISNMDGSWGLERFTLTSTRTDLYQLNLDGSYDDLVHYDKATINSRLEIRNPQLLGQVLGIKLAGIGPSRAQGKLGINKGRLHYDGEATVGNTNSTTTISGHLQDGKPVLTGSFEIPVLHLADFGIGPSATPIAVESDPDEPASPHVFSRKPLDINFLNTVDLDMAISIDEVESGELAIDSVRGKLQLRDGQLNVKPLRLVFEGGNTDIDLDVRATAVPEYRLVVKADEVTLGPLMAQFQGQVPIRGYTNIDLDLKARGQSPHELASSLSGNVNLGLENARVPKHYIDLLSVDVFGWVVSKSGATQQHMNLNCLVMTFTVKAGEVESETFISDGPRLSLGGEIDMNLGAETLDIVLIPQQKKRFFSSVSPVKITGPMKDPKVEAIPVKAALQEIGTMALLPGLVIPARALGKLWSLLDRSDQAGEGCANIEELRETAKRGNARDKGSVPVLDWLLE